MGGQRARAQVKKRTAGENDLPIEYGFADQAGGLAEGDGKVRSGNKQIVAAMA